MLSTFCLWIVLNIFVLFFSSLFSGFSFHVTEWSRNSSQDYSASQSNIELQFVIQNVRGSWECNSVVKHLLTLHEGLSLTHRTLNKLIMGQNTAWLDPVSTPHPISYGQRGITIRNPPLHEKWSSLTALFNIYSRICQLKHPLRCSVNKYTPIPYTQSKDTLT
jgi:hypothetical protein